MALDCVTGAERPGVALSDCTKTPGLIERYFLGQGKGVSIPVASMSGAALRELVRSKQLYPLNTVENYADNSAAANFATTNKGKSIRTRKKTFDVAGDVIDGDCNRSIVEEYLDGGNYSTMMVPADGQFWARKVDDANLMLGTANHYFERYTHQASDADIPYTYMHQVTMSATELALIKEAYISEDLLSIRGINTFEVTLDSVSATEIDFTIKNGCDNYDVLLAVMTANLKAFDVADADQTGAITQLPGTNKFRVALNSAISGGGYLVFDTGGVAPTVVDADPYFYEFPKTTVA